VAIPRFISNQPSARRWTSFSPKQRRVFRPSFVYFDTDLWRSALGLLQAVEMHCWLNIALWGRIQSIETQLRR
jgi:hypothetical protein